MATKVKIYSSEMYDRITETLVNDESATMANVALYLWYAKGVTDNLDQLKSLHQSLVCYIQSGTPAAGLVELTQNFPAMFDWYGKDIVHSDQAFHLMEKLGKVLEGNFSLEPHPFVLEAGAYLNRIDVTGKMERLLGLPWPVETVRLFVSPFLFNPTYVYPNTILCHVDPTCAAYVAMLAHEGGHILTLNLANHPAFRKKNRELSANLAEAIAHAIQMCMVDACGVRYEDLFPGQDIHNYVEYFEKGHPWLKDHAKMIDRLAEAIQQRGETPVSEVYQQVFDEFAG